MHSLRLLLPLLLLPLPLLAQEKKDDPFDNLYGERRAKGKQSLPKDPLARGQALLGLGRHDEAEATFRKILKKDAEAEGALRTLARLYLKTGRPGEAKQTATLLKKVQSDKPAAYLFLGILAEREGALKQARKAYEGAIALADPARNVLALEARVRLAELLTDVDAKAAEKQLRKVLEYYTRHPELTADEFAWTGRACRTVELFPQLKGEYSRHMSDYARRMLDQAFARDKRHAQAHLQAGQLALDKHNTPLAKKSFKKVISLDPNDPDARVGLAQATLASFYGGRAKYKDAASNLNKALAVDPTHPGAHATLAAIAVTDGSYRDALERVATGLRQRPGAVDLLAVRAAVHMLRGEEAGFAKVEQAVLAARPRCARFYVEVASLLQLKFRYAEARDLARKALKVNPGYSPALAILGVNLTRTGAELEGRKVLKRAFREDPYDLFVFNHLQLWDRLDKKYTTVQRKGYTLRLHKSELKVTTRYVTALIEEACRELGKKYGPLPKRILVEMFPDHNDFSARSVGLPGIPALGVCFGNVVTVLSSKGKKAVGAHSWGRTLWHELTHVATLTRTRNRVPRWFTEGLSVYEEPRGRKTWRREYDASIMVLMARGLLLPVATLDEGFTKPKYRSQVIMSYYQGGMICEFIAARWGFKKILALLDAFKTGKDTAAAVRAVFGLAPEAFDRHFRGFLERRYSRYAWLPPPSGRDRQRLLMRVSQAPWDVAARGALAHAYVIHGLSNDAEGQAGLALKHARAAQESWGPLGLGMRGPSLDAARALAIRAGAADAYLTLGVVARRRGRLGQATRHVRRALKLGTRDPVLAHRTLAQIHRVRKRWKDAIREYETVARLSPPEANLHRLLSACWQAAGDRKRSMAELRTVCRLDSNDAKARVRYARWAAKQNRWVEVVEVLDDVNLIDPFLGEAHVLLGDGLRRSAVGDAKKLERALGEYDAALELKVNYKAAPLFGKAACLHALKRNPKQALALVRKALQDDPDHAEARKLKEQIEGK